VRQISTTQVGGGPLQSKCQDRKWGGKGGDGATNVCFPETPKMTEKENVCLQKERRRIQGKGIEQSKEEGKKGRWGIVTKGLIKGRLQNVGSRGKEVTGRREENKVARFSRHLERKEGCSWLIHADQREKLPQAEKPRRTIKREEEGLKGGKERDFDISSKGDGS